MSDDYLPRFDRFLYGALEPWVRQIEQQIEDGTSIAGTWPLPGCSSVAGVIASVEIERTMVSLRLRRNGEVLWSKIIGRQDRMSSSRVAACHCTTRRAARSSSALSSPPAHLLSPPESSRSVDVRSEPRPTFSSPGCFQTWCSSPTGSHDRQNCRTDSPQHCSKLACLSPGISSLRRTAAAKPGRCSRPQERDSQSGSDADRSHRSNG
jgi:hypothetical protein